MKGEALPASKRVTIAAREAWVELLPVGDTYYRLEGGGRHFASGIYTARLNHDRKSFTMEAA